MIGDALKRIFLRGKLPYLWIFVFVFLIYFQTLFFGITKLDDDVLISDGYYYVQHLKEVADIFKQNIFRNGTLPYYRPLLALSFIFNALLGGQNPFVFHLTNILLHAVASCLFFLLLICLGLSRQKSLAFSLVFSLHPLLTQATAWIPGRNDSLLGVLFLGSFILFLKYLENKKAVYYLGHILIFVSALFVKESAALIPFICLSYLWLVKKEKLIPSGAKLLLAGWSAAGILWFLIRGKVLSSQAMSGIYGFRISGLFSNSPVIIQYLGKLFFPFNLSVYPIIKDTTFVFGAISLVVLAVLFFVFKNKDWRIMAFGGLWFAASFLPGLTFHNFTIPYDLQLEHRMYVPLMGILLAFSGFRAPRFKFLGRYSLVLAALVLSVLSLLTFIHSRNFKDRISFWENAAKTSPSLSVAHRELGVMYYLEGEDFYDKARREYEKAIVLDPDIINIHNNLGVLYLVQDMFEEAEQEFEKELSFHPLSDRTFYNLGLLRHKQGDEKAALEFWQKAFEINPSIAEAFYDYQRVKQEMESR